MIRLASLALILAAAPAAAEPDAAAGEALFAVHCSGCHGAGALGDGPLAPLLKVPAPDLTRLSERNSGTFPVFRVVRQIDGRDPLLAHGGEMPVFGNLYDFPDGSIKTETGQPIITAHPIADITAWLMTVQK